MIEHIQTIVIFLYLPGSFVSIGCWKDRGARAIPTLEGKDGRLKGNYQQRKNAIKLCYEAAKARGFQIFAIQHGGWCAAAKGGNISRLYSNLHLPLDSHFPSFNLMEMICTKCLTLWIKLTRKIKYVTAS